MLSTIENFKKFIIAKNTGPPRKNKSKQDIYKTPCLLEDYISNTFNSYFGHITIILSQTLTYHLSNLKAIHAYINQHSTQDHKHSNIKLSLVDNTKMLYGSNYKNDPKYLKLF